MKQYKVVYNEAVSGGIYLSNKALDYLREKGLRVKDDELKRYGAFVDFPRHNKVLVECVETLGEAANGPEDDGFQRPNCRSPLFRGSIITLMIMTEPERKLSTSAK